MATDSHPLIRPRSIQQLGLLILGALIALASLAMPPGSHLFTATEFWIRDTVLSRLSVRPGDTDIALIDIDETSLQAVGPWPWDRAMLAALTSVLIEQHGARIVAFDIVLPETKDPAGDAALLRLAQKRQLVLAQAFDFADREFPIATGAIGGGLDHKGLQPASNAAKATGYIANHAGLSSAPCVGNIGFIPDPDGKLRHIIHQTRYGETIYPSLALATAQCQTAQAMPRQVAGQQKLLFDIQPDKWTVVSAGTLFYPSLARTSNTEISKLLRDRAVIVGSSALGLSDRVATPISSSTSGMFVHAQALSEILHPRNHDTGQWGATLTVGVQASLIILFGIIVIRAKNMFRMFLGMGCVLAIWGWITIAQTQAGNALNLSAPLWGFLFYGLILVPYEWFSAQAKNRHIARVLARYVSKPVLQELLAQSTSSPLKPRSAEITVLVADMASYSQTVAQQSLDQAAQLTKDFLGLITEPIWDCRGTLDRYTGDGLIAFWGAPLADPNHARRAVEAARLMQAQIREFNRENAAKGLPELSVRIGIASGTALVGDFGSSQRANYTAVGNCINMASRLESAARDLKVDTVISDTTATMLSRDDLSALGHHEIRGIGSTALYTLA